MRIKGSDAYWWMGMMVAISLATRAGVVMGQENLPFGFGDIPLEKEEYLESLLSLDTLNALNEGKWDLNQAAEFDARTRGWVTEAKNQGQCGSCWAFASAGAIESRILKDGGPVADLSEQQQVSCNSYMSGCCGGSGSALKFYYNSRPLVETGAAAYSEAGTICPPTERTRACGTVTGLSQPYLASGFYTVQQSVDGFKTSVLTHGPSYFRYDVYSDFTAFWQNPAPGSVYKNNGGTRQGGHAVLLIGWSDSKQAYLFKNSWGKTGGPNGDGTFWMAYNGHSNDLGFQMFNITSLVRVSDGGELALNSNGPVPNIHSSTTAPAPTIAQTVAPLESQITLGGPSTEYQATPGILESLPAGPTAEPEVVAGAETAQSFGWYNNLRVNGSTRLTDTSGTTQISVYAGDVHWRYAFDSPTVRTPSGDGRSGGSGWQFPNAHRFGIVIFQGGRYWNVTSTSSTSPTVITGLTNTEPVRVMVNDTSGNYNDNGGAFDLYLRKDN